VWEYLSLARYHAPEAVRRAEIGRMGEVRILGIRGGHGVSVSKPFNREITARFSARVRDQSKPGTTSDSDFSSMGSAFRGIAPSLYADRDGDRKLARLTLAEGLK
jgi:hypothetical protein